MALVLHDLVCTKGHRRDDVLHAPDCLPDCHRCGNATRVSWHTGTAPGLSGFNTIEVGGKQRTTREVDAYAAQLERDNPGKRAIIKKGDAKADDRSIQERKHRITEFRKEANLDVKTHIDRQVEGLERKIIGLDRGKIKTSDVHRDIARAEKRIQQNKNSASRIK